MKKELIARLGLLVDEVGAAALLVLGVSAAFATAALFMGLR
ncbi:hypothetical protein [Phenylobacterium sp.]|jgi:hypothetical protein